MEKQKLTPSTKNKKYFVMSDVHSYYTAMKTALDQAGYNINDENHVFILCGDAFDRGDETLKVLKFLQSIPKERRVLIRGNHELLLKQCYERGAFYTEDEYNGTARTMCHLCHFNPDFRKDLYRKIAFLKEEEWTKEYNSKWEQYLTKPFKSKKIKQTVDWIFSDDWVNYFELEDFIFVHSWIPVKIWYDHGDGELHEDPLEDWRNASQVSWEEAMWGCPWEHYLAGSLPKGKTIVCGHWHVMDFHTYLGHDVNGEENRDIYCGERLIALDACTAKEPHLCNVLVIDGKMCYDKYGNVLMDRKEAI